MRKKDILVAFRKCRFNTSTVKRVLDAMKRQTDAAPLSSVEQGIWAIQCSNPEGIAYNVPIVLRIKRALDTESLRMAVDDLGLCFPLLTSTIIERGGEPCRQIFSSESASFSHRHVGRLSDAELAKLLAEAKGNPFDLGAGPLWRVHVFQFDDSDQIVMLVVHHILYDGASTLPLVKTLLDMHDLRAAGKLPDIVPQGPLHENYVAEERRWLESEEATRSLEYWSEHLAGDLPVLELPLDRPRPLQQSLRGKVVERSLPSSLVDRLSSVVTKLQVTRAALFLAVFKLLLGRYSGQNDIIVGVPISLRPFAASDAIGNFINLLPLRIRIDLELSFAEFAKEVQYTLNSGRDHGAYPFPELVKRLSVPRTGAVAPVFQAVYAYQNFSRGEDEKAFSDRYQATFMQIEHQAGEAEIGLELFERSAGCRAHLKFNPDLFDETTAERMMGHWLHLLEQITADQARRLCDYVLLTPEERERIVADWNMTVRPYPEQCLHELIDEQAERFPSASAVSGAGQTMSYLALKRASDSVRAALESTGIGPGALVGVCMSRSPNLLVALIGVMKTGAAYVPIDPEYPSERILNIVEDAQISHVMTDPISAPSLDSIVAEGTVTCLDTQTCIADFHTSEVIRSSSESESLAYVIYTSGSTGKPKGVMIPHRALVNLLSSMASTPGMEPGDRMLAIATFAFDMSVPELYLPLIVGAECILAEAHAARDPCLLAETIAACRPTIMQITPTACSMLFEAGWRNAERVKVLCGAEPLTESVRKQLIDTGTEAWNMYGPTETTVWSTLAPIRAREPITVGRPLANTRVYILDAKGQLLPPGLYGELCIAGSGVALGYLGRPALNAEKFAPDAIVESHDSGDLMYRTGDIARWLGNGSIEFRGRTDFQVKLRGFRIELGEIEAHLKRHQAIEDSVVIVNEQSGVRRLVAFVVLREGEDAPSWQALRTWLQMALPAHMVPAFYAVLPRIPLTPNGKVDRLVLAEEPLDKGSLYSGTDGEAAVSDLEAEVLDIWQEILKIDAIGVTDGFFDVGGDSVLAVSIATRIENRYEVSFSATALFKYANVRDITGYLHASGAKAIIPPVQDSPATPSESTEVEGTESGTSPSATIKAGPITFDRETSTDGLAIIGIALRVPGASDVCSFWSNLHNGVESIERVDSQQLLQFAIPSAVLASPQIRGVRATIEDKWRFDAEFFGVSMRDAAMMDPQMRQLLQHAWLAFEDAGYIPEQIPDTAVFASSSHSNYAYKIEPSSVSSGAAVLEDPANYVGWILQQGGTIPTIISHKLGLNGPSVYVHSNCSSSLSSLSAAWQTIQAGDAKHALVAAATLFAEDRLGYLHQPGLNFASDGHIKTFDADADGMVPGEGVAAVLVKRASDAIADRDRIYGIIRGVALNNDGAAKAGFYAPSVSGQAGVIDALLRKTDVEPKEIVYVEAHGTGTQLGDPIEVAALSEAYRQYGVGFNYCGLGSVKTNVGHLDTAAGLVGLIKVALSLEHGVMPPSLNFEEPNPRLELESSPFYIVDRATSIPLRNGPIFAAISAFGVGGTNAHALVEQYRAAPVQKQGVGATMVVPLSAKTEKQLRQRAMQLLDFLREPEATQLVLEDIAYTLQNGRVPMACREAFVVSSVEMLCEQLTAYIESDEIPGPKYTEQTNTQDAPAVSPANVAALWRNGEKVRWEELSVSGRRISLPGYPFDGDIYGPLSAELADDGKLHPLLHQNISTLTEIAFSSTFDGSESVLRDHILHGTRVLPGTAYLEMVYEAALRASHRSAKVPLGIELLNIVWIQPVIVVDAPVTVRVGMQLAAEPHLLEFEVTSGTPDSEGTVHCRGHVRIDADTEMPRIDLDVLREKYKSRRLSAAQCYQTYERLGLRYGPTHHGVLEVSGSREQMLASLSLPKEVFSDNRTIHAGLLDSAFQATIASVVDTAGNLGPTHAAVPFALKKIEVYGPCMPRMWAHIQVRQGVHGDVINRDEGDGRWSGSMLSKLDIDLIDEQGNVRVRIRELAARPFKKADATPAAQMLVAELAWTRAYRPVQPSTGDIQREVLLWGFEPQQAEAIAIALDVEQCAHTIWSSKPGDVPAQYHDLANRLLKRLQKHISSRPTERRLLQLLVAEDYMAWMAMGLGAMMKTAALENPLVAGQVIIVAATAQADTIIEILNENAADPHTTYIRSTNKGSEIGLLAEIPQHSPAAAPWKTDGVYLLTGGGGSIGTRLVEAIAEHVEHAVLVVVGRHVADDENRRPDTGRLTMEFMNLDVSDGEQVQSVVQELLKKYGRLDGILHCAGTLDDNFILNKNPEEMTKVLSPKVDGSWNLDLATAEVDLDFFVLFSSATAYLGNVGQVDYSCANSFMDAFSNWRNDLVSKGQRRGRTVSIGWPFWADGGMKIEAASHAYIEKQVGMMPMPTPAALNVLYSALAGDKSAVLALYGDGKRLRRTFLPTIETSFDIEQTDMLQSRDVDAEVVEYLKRALATLLHVAYDDVDLDAEFNELGLDANLIERFAEIISEMFDGAGLFTAAQIVEARSLRYLAKRLTVGAILGRDSEMVTSKNCDPTDSAQKNKTSHEGGGPAHDKQEGWRDEPIFEQTIKYLKKLVGNALRTPVGRLDAAIPLERYGIDSIVIVSLNSDLEKVFGSLSKTLFFEYQTLQELAHYFVAQHREKLLDMLGLANVAPGPKRSTVKSSAVSQQRSPSGVTLRPSIQSKALDIAIVGLAGRYPEADSVEEFWANLRDGKDSVTEIPKERWDHSKYFHPDKEHKGTVYSKWGGFINNADRFDSGFFNISPREAAILDPQERVFLETVFEAIEDAGYTRQALSAAQNDEIGVGVYVGVMYQEYQLFGAQATALGVPTALPSSPASIANRVSFFCNFHGPSMGIDSMCSSSLTAIHLACQSIRSGECSVAIAGGVNLTLHPNKYFLLSFGRFASSKGRCESFGAGGDGYVPGEGVGAVLLKPMEQALADGDHIYGIIKGSAINHGGKTNGFTVPNPKSQTQVIKRAIRTAEINPRDLSYIEAHGTGTSLGDPIEITALSHAFSEFTQDKQFCPIGSVKSNIGHCESAAGMAAITKVLMQLKYDTLAPSLHSETLNPNIDFLATPFYVQRERTDWSRQSVRSSDGRSLARLCAVSSFGAGGANAHLIIEEHVGEQRVMPPVTDKRDYVVVLSARTPDQLKQQAKRLREWLDTEDHGSRLAELEFTLQTGRETMEHRFAVVTPSSDVLRYRLDLFLSSETGQIDDSTDEVFHVGHVMQDDPLTPLAHDGAFQNAVAQWVEEGRMDRLASLWVRGLELDWMALWPDMTPSRIGLPTYPFKRERHWGVPDLSGLHVEQLGADKLSVSKVSKAPVVKESSGRVGIVLADIPSVTAPQSLPKEKTISKPAVALVPLDTTPQANDLTAKSVGGKADNASRNIDNAQSVNATGIANTGDTESFLVESLAKLLMMVPEELGRDATFVDLGVDSIVGVEWVRGINDHFDCAISATAIYEHPTIRVFSRLVASTVSVRYGETQSITTTPTVSTQDEQEVIQPEPEQNPSDMENMNSPALESGDIREYLLASLGEALCLSPDEIQAHKPFVDLGLDSIVGVEWITTINRHLGVDLSAGAVYEFPTLNDLAAAVASNIKALHNGVDILPDFAGDTDVLLQAIEDGKVDVETAEVQWRKIKAQESAARLTVSQ